VRKYFETDPQGYADAARIHLVSSFVAYLLTARDDTPVDPGDGAGMNLLDLARGDWSAVILDATAPALREKLPPVRTSDHIVGAVARYFVERYGFRPDTRVTSSTRDNPSSLIGMNAAHHGSGVISLGTSHTYFAAMTDMRTDPQGHDHVCGNSAGGFMSLV
jgi:xylulokinase